MILQGAVQNQESASCLLAISALVILCRNLEIVAQQVD
ncbi:hypothetical protein N234_37485 [Ralstonia pickettii DTP0602]|nr:hypothetical protein N234_37485 [Ralstonia pickettii DTP0602]